VMDLERRLASFISPDAVLVGATDLAAYATDASLYRITPRAVVRPRDTNEVSALLAFARREKVPLTFRAAGTSLSGQALGPGIVVDCSWHWKQLTILDQGRRVRVGPGVVAGLTNRRLAPFGVKLGPDPASIDACMIGGVVANNSSGMCCGVEQNAYHTLESLVFLLPSGTVVDSAEPRASERLRGLEPRLWQGISELRDRVCADHRLVERIRRKYRLKNTMGYSLNAFVDFQDPLEILWHLLVGSEGTLAFLISAVFRTVPDLPHKSTGLLFFEDVRSACACIAPLREAGAAALELMDRVSLRSVERRPGVPDFVSSLPAEASALLLEQQAGSAEELAASSVRLDQTLIRLPVLRRTPVTRDRVQQAALWAVRKGIIPSVGAVRRRGTTLVTEDVVFPVEHLADGVLGLQDLFRKHRYDDSAIFGHAKDGNLHFLLAQGTNHPREVEQFSSFLEDLATLVIGRHEGALKAEHGTGRNMAPFLEKEWGPEACAIMRELKQLVDPDGILNPGVILNDDPQAHVTHLKTIPRVDEEADRCIECGFCEPKCPSLHVTMSPRQRIMVRREVERLKLAGRMDAARELESRSRYQVLDTCATDGLCATACPVEIDTGKMVKRLRGERLGAFGKWAAGLLADRFSLTERAARLALQAGHLKAAVVGDSVLEYLSRAGSKFGLPRWSKDMPRAAGPLPVTDRAGASAVYLPSCVTRIFASSDGDPSLAEIIVKVAARAGVPVWIPADVSGKCCGMPFSSKGYAEAQARLLNRTIERLWDWSDEGLLPVVLDTSPCAWTLRTGRAILREENQKKFDAMRILDGTEFARQLVLPTLPIRRKVHSVALHPVCSVVKLGLTSEFREVARACASEVFVPVESGCCGFAGDRGFLVPELTEAATRRQAAEIRSDDFDGYYSSSRTCEIGMTRATGKPWRSIWTLLDEVSRAD
jgi:D-lactate dehydrogenase